MTLANSSFILANLTSDSAADTPNARKLSVVSGLLLTDNGPQGTLLIGLQGALNSLQNPTSSHVGFPSYNNSTQVYLNRTLIGGTGMQITNGDGVGGNPTFNIIPGSVLQKVQVSEFGEAPLGSYSYLQFAAAGGIRADVTDIGGGESAKITFTGEDLGTVTSIGIDSSTGLLVSNTPITTSGTIHVNLPGSGGSNAVVTGDTLYGDGSLFKALAIGSNGQIMTVVSGKPAWTTNVGIINVSITSSSGIVITNASPIASNTTVTINLPGSDAGAVAVGDMLVGGEGGEYTSVGIGPDGEVWTSNGTTAGWAVLPDVTPWYEVPNNPGDDGSNVQMAGHDFLSVGNIRFAPVASSLAPAGTGLLGIDTDADNHLYYNSHDIPGQYVVTAPASGFAASYSILFGSPTAGTNYTPTVVAPTEGQFVGFQGGTVQWTTLPDVTPWYEVPNKVGDEGSTVEMAGHDFSSVGNILFSPVASSGAPAGTGLLGVDTDTNNHLYYNSDGIPDQYVVTAPSDGFAASYSILFGAPSGGFNYTPTVVAPTEGQVVGFQDGTVKWIENTVNILPADFIQLNPGPLFNDATAAIVAWFYVEDDHVTDSSVISAWPQGNLNSLGVGIQPASGQINVVVYPSGPGETGFGVGYLIQSTENEGGAGVGYQVVKY